MPSEPVTDRSRALTRREPAGFRPFIPAVSGEASVTPS
jgi:hypothetical protein